MTRRLRLEVRIDDLYGVAQPQLVPWVDGTVLGLGLPTRADAAGSGLGMDPDALLDRRGPLYPPELHGEPDDQDPRATVWRCSCGIPGCASIGVRVRSDLDDGRGVVVWDQWRIQPGFARELASADPPPLVFDARDYYAELTRAGADRWWEDGARRVGRELTAALDVHPELLGRRGLGLEWARGYVHDGAGRVTVALRDRRGHHYLELPCDPAADPAVQARQMADLLAGTDPADLPGHRLADRP